MSSACTSALRSHWAAERVLCSRCLLPRTPFSPSPRRFIQTRSKVAAPATIKQRPHPSDLFPTPTTAPARPALRPSPPSPEPRRRPPPSSAAAVEPGLSVLELLRPERVDFNDPSSTDTPPPHPSQPDSSSSSTDPILPAAQSLPPSTATSAAAEPGESLLDLLRPERVDFDLFTYASAPPTSQPDAPQAVLPSSAAVPQPGESLLDLMRPDRINSATSDHTPPPPTPQPDPPSPPTRPPARALVPSTLPPQFFPRSQPRPPSSSLSSSSSSSLVNESDDADGGDEEFQRYMHEPLTTLPTFDEVSEQIDSLLDISVHGHKMFPLYMRPELKLRTLRYVLQTITPPPPSTSPSSPPPSPLTHHTLHTRLFTHLIKHASKLAHTDDERVTIVCPDAPHVGSKVPHPQWPELTTVVRRYFTQEVEWADMEVDERRLAKEGKVRVSELFSGLDPETVQVGLEGDEVVDVDELDESALQFEGDGPAPPAGGKAREAWEEQREAREAAKEMMRNRIRVLKAKAQAAREGREVRVEAAVMKRGMIRQLAVVYRFDSSEQEFEMRYPLTKRDVQKLELYEEHDDANTVIE